MKEGTIYLRVTLVPDDELAKAAAPREEPFDDPAAPVSPHAALDRDLAVRVDR
jgi:hypothetical protein